MQQLRIQQINEAVTDAVERHIPLNLSVSSEGWANLHSRFLAVRDEHLLVELPSPAPGGNAHEFVPAEKVALSFKLKHHKYLSNTRVAGIEPWTLEDGTETASLALCFPTQMQRLQRRSFTRVAVPEGRVVRVTFWSGEKDVEPSGPSPVPVWSGRVVDLSAGGFQAILSCDEAPTLCEGDSVGVRIAFGPGEASIYCNAQYRHCRQQEDRRFSAGFQFIGLTQTDEGRDLLRTIGRKMNEFVRFADRTRQFTEARSLLSTAEGPPSATSKAS